MTAVWSERGDWRSAHPRPPIGTMIAASFTNSVLTVLLALGNAAAQSVASERADFAIAAQGLGFGGGDATGAPSDEDTRQKRSDKNRGQDPSTVQVIGAGTLLPDQRSKLTAVEARNFDSLKGRRC